MADRSTWRKSSYSSPQDGNCVEIACLGDDRAVRDSKSPDRPGTGVHRGAVGRVHCRRTCRRLRLTDETATLSGSRSRPQA
jgi:hypothetical protein